MLSNPHAYNDRRRGAVSPQERHIQHLFGIQKEIQTLERESLAKSDEYFMNLQPEQIDVFVTCRCQALKGNGRNCGVTYQVACYFSDEGDVVPNNFCDTLACPQHVGKLTIRLEEAHKRHSRLEHLLHQRGIGMGMKISQQNYEDVVPPQDASPPFLGGGDNDDEEAFDEANVDTTTSNIRQLDGTLVIVQEQKVTKPQRNDEPIGRTVALSVKKGVISLKPTVYHYKTPVYEQPTYEKTNAGVHEFACVLCTRTVTQYGNNAIPIAEGEACDQCNFYIVLPARFKSVSN